METLNCFFWSTCNLICCSPVYSVAQQESFIMIRCIERRCHCKQWTTRPVEVENAERSKLLLVLPSCDYWWLSWTDSNSTIEVSGGSYSEHAHCVTFTLLSQAQAAFDESISLSATGYFRYRDPSQHPVETSGGLWRKSFTSVCSFGKNWFLPSVNPLLERTFGCYLIQISRRVFVGKNRRANKMQLNWWFKL